MQLEDPGYYPCNCDLTVNICDLNCCCDPKCTRDDLNAFDKPCLNQIRPIFDPVVNQYYCTDIYNSPIILAPDWYPIMCIHVRIFSLFLIWQTYSYSYAYFSIYIYIDKYHRFIGQLLFALRFGHFESQSGFSQFSQLKISRILQHSIKISQFVFFLFWKFWYIFFLYLKK